MEEETTTWLGGHNGQSSPAVFTLRLAVSNRDAAIGSKRTWAPSGAAACYVLRLSVSPNSELDTTLVLMPKKE